MPDVPATPDARRRLRAATERVFELKAAGAALLYDLGAVLREVEDEALWRAGGFASFTAWLSEAVEVSRPTAARAIEVTRHFSRDVALRYGMEKLYWGLRYVAATRADEQPGDLIAADLRLRGPSGPFHEASLRQVQEAVRLRMELRDKRPAFPGPSVLDAAISTLEAGLPPAPKGLPAPRSRVEMVHAPDGAPALNLRHLPLKRAQLLESSRLLAALAEQLDDDDDDEG